LWLPALAATIAARVEAPTIAALGPKDGSRVGDATRELLLRPGAVTGKLESRPGGISDLTLGRDLLPSHGKIIDAVTEPGLILRNALPLDQLVEGANTLTVSVLGAQPGDRVDRVTTFLALPPAPARPPTYRTDSSPTSTPCQECYATPRADWPPRHDPRRGGPKGTVKLTLIMIFFTEANTKCQPIRRT
jgi:hypothetical protein